MVRRELLREVPLPDLVHGRVPVAGAAHRLHEHPPVVAVRHELRADHRMPLGMARLTLISSTRGRDQAGSKRAGSDVFDVHVEPVQILYRERTIITAPLRLKVLVAPSGEASVRTLATLRTWPTPPSPRCCSAMGRNGDN